MNTNKKSKADLIMAKLFAARPEKNRKEESANTAGQDTLMKEMSDLQEVENKVLKRTVE